MPGTITYTSSTNTLRAVGGTSSAPVTMADVLAADVANGWGVITSPATGVYLLNANLEIGDVVTATYFRLNDSILRMADNCLLTRKANSTFSAARSSISVSFTGQARDDGVVIYDKVMLIYRQSVGGYYRHYGKCTWTDVLVSAVTPNRYSHYFYHADSVLTRVTCDSGLSPFTIMATIPAISNITAINCSRGISPEASVSVSGFTAMNCTIDVRTYGAITARVVDSEFLTVENGLAGSAIIADKSVSLLLHDPAGDPLPNATATLVDQFGTQVFSLTSDASGATAEQAVTVKQWVGTAETLTEFNPFTLTISHADYPTMTIPGLTISAPLRNWRIDMGMSTAQVQAAMAAAMTAQGYTDTRATNLDNLDAQISSRAVPGDAMTLTAAYDAAKSAASAQDVEARTLPSAEYATAEQVAAIGAGNGAIEWDYTLTHGTTGAPIADAFVKVTSDQDGLYQIASGTTDQYGVVTFQLDAGTVYLWRYKSGWSFVNPDVEVVA